MAPVAYRPAALEDAAEIHELLLRLVPEIPLLVDTLEREEALYALTRQCARSGESWVAADAKGRIVGFVLVELSPHARHYAEHEVLEMRYAGVAPEYRNRGIGGELIAKIVARLVPVTVSIGAKNRSGFTRLLEKRGFCEITSPGGEHRLRWDPGQP